MDAIFKAPDGEAYSYPIKVKYLTSVSDNTINGEEASKIAASVPKRKFKTAVQRNILKRRIVEAYRLNNKNFKISLNNQDLQINLVFMYIGTIIEEYIKIESAIIKVLNQIENQINGRSINQEGN